MEANPTTTDIRPFRVGFSDEDLNELTSRRIAATRWPSRELVTDRSQGVQLEAILEVRSLLDIRLPHAPVLGEAERTAAV